MEERENACRLKDKWKSDKKNKEPLLLCKHDDVEQNTKNVVQITCRHGARVKVDVHDRDLKAITIMYHKACYSAYTNKQQLELLQNKQDDKLSNEQL